MPFVHTVKLLDLLKCRLESLLVDPAADARLFERVGYFGAEKLGEALKATFAAENRVCFIVPIGNDHATTRDRSFMFTQRETKIALLIGDKTMDRTQQAALVGGEASVGVLELADKIVDDLMANAFAVPDLAFVPGAGQPLVIEQKDGNNLGRSCWMQEFTVYAGSERRAIA